MRTFAFITAINTIAGASGVLDLPSSLPASNLLLLSHRAPPWQRTVWSAGHKTAAKVFVNTNIQERFGHTTCSFAYEHKIRSMQSMRCCALGAPCCNTIAQQQSTKAGQQQLSRTPFATVSAQQPRQLQREAVTCHAAANRHGLPASPLQQPPMFGRTATHPGSRHSRLSKGLRPSAAAADDDDAASAQPDIDQLAAFLTQKAAQMRASMDEQDLLPTESRSDDADADSADVTSSQTNSDADTLLSLDSLAALASADAAIPAGAALPGAVVSTDMVQLVGLGQGKAAMVQARQLLCMQ